MTTPSFAEGYPFDPESQQVTEDTMRIRISREQIKSLSSSGQVTLTNEQLNLIHQFYPKANKVQSVMTATVNDNTEEEIWKQVHIFWVAAEEIAITLNSFVIKDKLLRDSALAEARPPSPSDIRISPEGEIFIKGERCTLKDAYEVITKQNVVSGINDNRQVNVCVAPPFRLREHRDMDDIVKDTFTSLAAYGSAHNVNVVKTW